MHTQYIPRGTWRMSSGGLPDFARDLAAQVVWWQRPLYRLRRWWQQPRVELGFRSAARADRPGSPVDSEPRG